MRRLALAVVLACVLSGAVSAGEIPSTGVPAPPTSSSVVTPGEIPSGDRTTPQPFSMGEIPSTGGVVLTILLSMFRFVR